MKNSIALLFLVLYGGICLSQGDSVNKINGTLLYEPISPSFPGGKTRMLKFIQLVKSFPDSAKEGKVFIQFIVKKTGELTDMKIFRSPDSLLSQEAIRILKLMPNWNPGTNYYGDTSDFRMVLPMVFKKNLEEVYQVEESMPKYPGGEEALFEFISKSIKFHTSNLGSITSKFYFEFIIEKDGSISNLKLKNNNPEILMNSALAFTEMPNWDPTIINGKAVRFKMCIPLIISLR